MIRKIFTCINSGFEWVDVVDPTQEELQRIAEQYGLHPTSVQDCLDPDHLPKFEKIGNSTFLIARAYDELSDRSADTVVAMTRKVAVFFNDQHFITIHRRDQRFLTALMERWKTATQNPSTGIPSAHCCPTLLMELLQCVIRTYEPPMTIAETSVERFETLLFDGKRGSESDVFQNLFLQKRRITAIRRILIHSSSLVHKMNTVPEPLHPLLQDLHEDAESAYLSADELVEDVNNLLSMQLSLASHRTNEIMRVLTLFSVFFMPLTFLVGIYGMNFQNMPEVSMKYGYLGVWIVILAISGGIFIWFRHKGWLK